MSFDEPPCDDERDVETNDEERDEMYDRVEALRKECARQGKELTGVYADLAAAIELVRRADSLIGVVPNAAENAKWERDARAFLDPLDGKPAF